MSTIFPREEKTEQIFDEILKNPHACERLKDTFFEAIPSAEESEGAGTDIPGTVFAAALFTAYENKDLSAFMMAVCNSSVFDLLRNSFLISIRFNDKGVENPIFLTDENGDLLSGSHQHACAKKYKMFHKLYEQQDEIPDYSASDFYEMEIGTSAFMRGYMARPCDMYFTLERKLARFLSMSLSVFKVPQEEQEAILSYIENLNIREIANTVMQQLFVTLEMKYEFTLTN